MHEIGGPTARRHRACRVDRGRAHSAGRGWTAVARAPPGRLGESRGRGPPPGRPTRRAEPPRRSRRVVPRARPTSRGRRTRERRRSAPGTNGPVHGGTAPRASRARSRSRRATTGVSRSASPIGAEARATRERGHGRTLSSGVGRLGRHDPSARPIGASRMPSDSPLAVDGLDVNQVKDGLIVYDPARDRVHYLNNTAAAIFTLCDGDHGRRRDRGDRHRVVRRGRAVARRRRRVSRRSSCRKACSDRTRSRVPPPALRGHRRGRGRAPRARAGLPGEPRATAAGPALHHALRRDRVGARTSSTKRATTWRRSAPPTTCCSSSTGAATPGSSTTWRSGSGSRSTRVSSASPAGAHWCSATRGSGRPRSCCGSSTTVTTVEGDEVVFIRAGLAVSQPRNFHVKPSTSPTRAGARGRLVVVADHVDVGRSRHPRVRPDRRRVRVGAHRGPDRRILRAARRPRRYRACA